MSFLGEHRTLPVRGWFALAAITTFVLVVVVVLVSVFVLGASDITSRDQIERAVAVVRDGGDQWHDADFREATASALADDDVSLVLVEDDEVVLRSVTGSDQSAGGDAWDAERDNGIVRYVDIDEADPPLTAQLYTPLGGDNPVPGVVRATLFITVIAVAVALAFGRPFVRSLRAVRQAASRVTQGDLDVSLPRSRITELDDVNIAFATMTAELNRSLRQQAELEHERRLFIAAIAHDLRTPLFSLRGYLEGLESGIADTPEHRARYVAIANEKARTLDRLVADLFDYTRVEYLDQSLRLEPLDLAEFLHDLVDGLRPQADSKGLTLELWPHDHSCPIDADRDQLARAVTNVVSNAIRYTPSGERVDVACGLTRDSAWFTVTDTGPGIDPNDLPHLFRPLYRGENGSDDAPVGGLGLGLAIAHRILTAHHGTLHADNSPTGGAIFTATIPATSSPVPPPGPRPDPIGNIESSEPRQAGTPFEQVDSLFNEPDFRQRGL